MCFFRLCFPKDTGGSASSASAADPAKGMIRSVSGGERVSNHDLAVGGHATGIAVRIAECAESR
jgi:hypothetical protein